MNEFDCQLLDDLGMFGRNLPGHLLQRQQRMGHDPRVCRAIVAQLIEWSKLPGLLPRVRYGPDRGKEWSEIGDDVRIVQLTPPCSGCSVVIGEGAVPAMPPGSLDDAELQAVRRWPDRPIRRGSR